MMRKFGRRDFFKSSLSLLSAGGIVGLTSSRAKADDISSVEISNESLSAELNENDVDSRAYLSALSTEDQTITDQPHEFSGINPGGDRLRYRSTERNERLINDGWEAIETERIFEYSENAFVSITHQLTLPPEEPILFVKTSITNNTNESITIDRPDEDIHEGMMLIRTPPLYSPQGTYRYYVEGHSQQAFSDSDLWLPYGMDENQRFITCFGSETAITTSYLNGHTAPLMAITRTTEDVDDQTGLPHSEENPPARQTIGFEVDSLDFGVNGFTMSPDESVEYVVAVSTHEGGENAVSNAREITQEAESLWDDVPNLIPESESTEEGPAGVLFRQTSEATDNPAVLLAGGAVTTGLGYLAYNNLKNDDEEEPTEETTTGSDRNESSTVVSESSITSSLSVERYDDLDVGEMVERHENVHISQATAQNSLVWVLTPENDRETIDISQFEAFEDQAELWANMDDHANLLSVYGYGSEPMPWIAVEPAENSPLGQCTTDRTTEETVGLLVQACEAVHHIQRYGLAYQHLSLESVLVDGETVTLQGVLDHTSTNESGYPLPTFDEDPEDELADVYRLGALAYEVLTGSQPVHPDLTPPSERAPMLPAVFDEVLLKALAVAPEDRYETVLHLRDELRDSLEQI